MIMNEEKNGLIKGIINALIIEGIVVAVLVGVGLLLSKL